MPIVEKFSDIEIKELDNIKGRIIYNTTNNTIQYNNGDKYINIDNIDNTDINNKLEILQNTNENNYKDILNKLSLLDNTNSNIFKKLNEQNIEGILTTSDQPNITSIGKLKQLELEGNITGVNKLITKEIEGIILSPNQINITKIGDLEELTITKKLNIKELNTLITQPIQPIITELGTLNNLNILGITNINTISNYAQLSINNNSGKCIRLIYNSIDGKEQIYSDINIDILGNLNLNPTGNFIKTEKCIQVNNDKFGFKHRSTNGIEFITSINQSHSVSIGSYTNHNLNLITNNINRVTIDNNGNIGIGTLSPKKSLTINSITGGSMRLIYNDTLIYTDYYISENGTVIFDINSNKSKGYIFNGGNVQATISTPEQPFITMVGTLTKLNMNGPINNATDITAKTITGQLLTSSQPNIQLVGELNKLKINSNFPLLYESTYTPQLALFTNTIERNGSYIEIKNNIGTQMKLGIDGKGYAGGENTSVALSCWTKGDLRFITNKLDRMIIKSDGLVGININNPQKQLTINSNTGDCLRLIYNNLNTYLDLMVKHNGNIIFQANGDNPNFQFIGGDLFAKLSKSDQPNITSVGILSKLEMTGEIKGVTNLSANTISGMITTPIQPNILSIGTLTKLELNGILSSTYSSTNGIMAIFNNKLPDNGSYIEINNNNSKALFGLDGKENINDVILGNYSKGNLKIITNSIEYLRLQSNGTIGINTILSKKQLSINSDNGECLRLIYNNKKGTEDKYFDVNILSNGNTDLITSGKFINIKNNIIIGDKNNNKNIIQFNNRDNYYNKTVLIEQLYNDLNNSELLIYKGVEKNRIRFRSYEYIFQTINDNTENIETTNIDNNNKLIISNNGNISINTNNNLKQLNINSKTGECIRLIYDNIDSIYLDISINKNGLILFNSNGDNSGFKFSGGNIDGILSTPNQPNITSLGILDNLNISGKLCVNELSTPFLDTLLIKQDQCNITSLGKLKYLNIEGKVNIDTDYSEMKLNINENNGNCLRLIFNNSNKFIDLIADIKGNLHIKPTGEFITTSKQFEIIKNGLGFSHKSENNIEFITSISNISGVSIGSYSNDSVNFITNNMSRLTIDKYGKIGIGNQNPIAILDLGSLASRSLLYLYNNNDNIYGFGILNNTLLYQSGNCSNHAWYTNSNTNNIGTELMKLIGETGYLGINITNPLYPLHINGFEKGIAHSLDDITFNTYINKKDKNVILHTSTNHSLIIGSNNKDQLFLSNNGNIGIGTKTPISLLHLNSNNKNAIIIENVLNTSTANIQYKTDKCIWELGARGSNNTPLDSFYLFGNKNDRLVILSNGLTGINTILPKKQLSINSDTGECLRLSYNNSLGYETSYLDCEVSKDGKITFKANGSKPKFEFIGGELDCILSSNDQPNITSIGTLSKLNIIGDLTVLNNIYSKYINGIVQTQNQPYIKTLGVLDNLKVSTIINNFNIGGVIVKSYNSSDMTGRLIKEEILTSIELNKYSPNGINNYWSVEILGYIQPKYSELYTFYIISNNKFRCWINNKLLFNAWKINNERIDPNSIELNMDQWYPIYIQYAKEDVINDTFILKWESLSQPIEILNNLSLSWDNHIDNYNLRYPLTTKNNINIYNSNTENNINGSITINDNGNMLLKCTNNTFDMKGGLYATLLTENQPNITSIGTLTELKVNGNITCINKLEANKLVGIIETSDQPNITSIGKLTHLEVYGDITNINKIKAKELEGVILTNNQPNITSIGTLTHLNILGKITGITEIDAKQIIGTILTNNQPNITSIGELNDLKVNGLINTNQLEINSNNNNCLKLLYNKDKYNSKIYTDFILDSNGNLSINSSGDNINTNNSININNSYGLQHSSDSGIKIYTYINNNESYIGNMSDNTLHITTNKYPRITINKDGYIGINSISTSSQMVINNSKGNCLRLVYNSKNNEILYTDLNVDSNGNLSINTAGNTIYTSSQLRIQSETGIGLSILSPNGLHELITHVVNNCIQFGSSTNTVVNMITNKKNRLTIDGFGNISIMNKINIVSDIQYIQNKKNIDNEFCKKFINIEPKQYNKIDSDDSIHFGYIAQDLINNGYESLTNIIHEEDKSIHTVSTTDIIPLLAKNIKILYDENKELKDRLELLEKLILKDE